MRVCWYCLGLHAGRADAHACSTACRVAIAAAGKCVSFADLAPASCRRSSSSEERRANTGTGRVGPRESYEADLRVRVMVHGEQIEHLSQWEAVNQLPADVVADRLGLAADAWRELGERLVVEREQIRASLLNGGARG